MTLILKQIRQNIFLFIIIIVMLFLQAFFDLSLPKYTSDIINNGISRNGITEKHYKYVSESTLEKIKNNGIKTKKVKNSPLFETDKNVYEITNYKELKDVAYNDILNEYKSIGINLTKLQNDYIIITCIKMVLITLFSVISAAIFAYAASIATSKIAANLRKNIFKKVLTLSKEEVNKFTIASLITRSTNDVTQIQSTSLFLIRILIYAPLMGIGGIFRMLGQDNTLLSIIVYALLAIVVIFVISFFFVVPKFEKVQKYLDKINLIIREQLNGLLVVRAFYNQKFEEDRFNKVNKKLTNLNIFVNSAASLLMPLMMLIINIVGLLIVKNGAHLVNNNIILVGDIVAFTQYATQILFSFLMISFIGMILPKTLVSANRINEVLNIENSIKNKGTIRKKILKPSIEFKNVYFKYSDALENVLSNINFTINEKETVAFIGSTGSGKSTLINLIPRFMNVTSGKILINDISVEDYDLTFLRSNIAYVSQKGILFSGTIKENINLGVKNNKNIDEVIDIADIKKFVLEKNNDFIITRSGANVSGGQRQRLSIARALQINPSIIIFDDSFSALDYQTELNIRKKLKKLYDNATVLIVAQRISTVMHADKIIVMDEGKINAIGTHKELLQTSKLYQEIAFSQLSEEEIK